MTEKSSLYISLCRLFPLSVDMYNSIILFRLTYIFYYLLLHSPWIFFNENTVLRGVSLIFAHHHLQTTEHFWRLFFANCDLRNSFKITTKRRNKFAPQIADVLDIYWLSYLIHIHAVCRIFSKLRCSSMCEDVSFWRRRNPWRMMSEDMTRARKDVFWAIPIKRWMLL